MISYDERLNWIILTVLLLWLVVRWRTRAKVVEAFAKGWKLASEEKGRDDLESISPDRP